MTVNQLVGGSIPSRGARIVVIPSKRRHVGPGYHRPADPPKGYLAASNLKSRETNEYAFDGSERFRQREIVETATR